MIDHYATLDIPRDAGPALIITAWRRAASIYHPDRPTGDIEKFRAAREAFNCLSDRAQRAKHDAILNGAADPGLLSEDDYTSASERVDAGEPPLYASNGDCMMCGNSREVRVAAAGFWTRRRCPACSS